jgi:hypothetical protein
VGSEKDVRMDAVSYDNIDETWKQFKAILTNKPLILITLAVTALYFVVTGIQVGSKKENNDNSIGQLCI